MKKILMNCIFLLTAFFTCTGMFILKYQVLDKEKQLARLHQTIFQNQRTIHILKAEWTHLNDPQRIRYLITNYTHLTNLKANQIIELGDVKLKQAPIPMHKPVVIPVVYEE